MKRLFFTIVLLVCITSVYAQKIAFVDSKYILSNVPAYKAAKDKLEEMSFEWQKEIEAQYLELEKLQKKFQNEKILLTEDMIKERENDLMTKEQQIRELQKKYFGPEGDLFKKRQELIQPIQDELYEAVKAVADDENLAVIFDTASGPNVLFADPKYDMSDLVLEKMGYKN